MERRGRFGLIRGGSTVMRPNAFTSEGLALMRLPNAAGLNLALVTADDIQHTLTDFLSASTTRTGSPGNDGKLRWQVNYVFDLPPEELDPILTFNRARSLATGDHTGTVISEGLLLGELGEPASVVVNRPEESVKLVWEMSEYVPAEAVRTITLTKWVSGVATVSQHTVTIRPANFLNALDSSKGWYPIATPELPSAVYNPSRVRIGVGDISIYSSEATFSTVFAADTFGSNLRAEWGFDAVGNFDCVQFNLGHTEWQASIDPPIVKTEDDRLVIDLALLLNGM